MVTMKLRGACSPAAEVVSCVCLLVDAFNFQVVNFEFEWAPFQLCIDLIGILDSEVASGCSAKKFCMFILRIPRSGLFSV